MKRLLVIAGIVVASPALVHGEDSSLKSWLDREIIGQKQSLEEVKTFVEARIPRLPEVTNKQDWQARAERLRREVLAKVVFRGEAARWRDAETKVQWLEALDGGPGYKIKKLRYEALPGMWIPALLYEPNELAGKVPVVMNVNGHDRAKGKAAEYKQIRCINQAKRGMLALNVEWLGMGQLQDDGFSHSKMNQLDLCGASGLAPFYLSMSRGLDLLLAHQHADPTRVAVAGLSGGGWQTIFISALDPRVTLANPVAGYSSFLTRLRHAKDLGDSEQTPCDMATVADYTHLTALLAPRAALLTYNAKDNCCFEAGYALQPLLQAAEPIYKLYGKEANLAQHTNHDPGDHNFGKDNRQALYRMFAQHFSTEPNSPLPAEEIDCEGEVKSKEELRVELPPDNLNFHTLALDLMKRLQHPVVPSTDHRLRRWQNGKRAELIELVQAKADCQLVASKVASDSKGEDRAAFWRLRIGDQWTVPAVEIARGEPQSTTIVIADGGRSSAASRIESLLASGTRVVAVDPFYFGESKISERDFLHALQVATVGQRPLGIQASQIAAIARWLKNDRQLDEVSVTALGPRTSLIALVAAAVERRAIASLHLRDSYGSLKQVIEEDRAVDQTPEMFCFGLLEKFDVKQLAALAPPREISLHDASDRAKQELADLKKVYALTGKEFDPIQ